MLTAGPGLGRDDAGHLFAEGAAVRFAGTPVNHNAMVASGFTAVAANRVGAANTIAWRHTSGAIHFWQLDAGWQFTSSHGWQLPGTPAFRASETSLGIDADEDGFIGTPPQHVIESIGGVALTRDAAGQLYANASAIRFGHTGVMYDAMVASGFTPVAAERHNNVNHVAWRHSSGALHRWRLDDSWSFTSSFGWQQPGSQPSRRSETVFRLDLDTDGVIGDPAATDPLVTLAWEGRPVDAVRHSWVMRMPQTNAATATSPLDYAWQHPTAPAGWTLEPFGYGFYGVTAPGASPSQVASWTQSVGVTSWQPNNVTRVAAVAQGPSLQAFPDDPPNDPRYGDLWGLTKIDAAAAWRTTTGSSDIIVGVIDSGIDYTHPDLAANMWRRPANVPASIPIAPGVLPDLPEPRTIQIGEFGINTATNTTGPDDPMDTQGHGTHVAGTIAAVGNNGQGVIGVAPGVKVFAAKAQGLGQNGQPDPAARSINTNATIRAMATIVNLKQNHGQNFVAVNASYGGGGPAQRLERDAIGLINAANILFVAAAGNGGPDGIGDDNDRLPQYPANHDLPNVVSVAASDQRDGLTRFSNYGPRTVHIAAPGIGIWSTTPQGNYAAFAGTSMAAPHVTGVAALVASAYTAETGQPASVEIMRGAILEGSRRLAVRGRVAGDRLLNARGALDALDEILNPRITVRAPTIRALEGNAGTKTFEFVVGLSRPAGDQPIAVRYATIDGSATAGEDYLPASGTLVFAAGEQFQTVRVTILGDMNLEEHETFQFVISDPVNGRLGDVTSIEFTILNDDMPQLTITPAVAIEGTGRRTKAEFVVSLAGAVPAPVMLSYTTRDGTARAGQDYIPAQGNLVFSPGERQKRISVDVIGDQLAEADEYFELVVVSVRNASLANAEPVRGWILDDDSRLVSITALHSRVAAGADAAFRITVSRMAGYGDVLPSLPAGAVVPEAFVTVRYATANGTAAGGPTGHYGTTGGGREFGLTSPLEQVVVVPTRPVDRARTFSMRLFDVSGARLGKAVEAVTISPS